MSFRPQQGLLIMNDDELKAVGTARELFPSPTGVTYYEFYTTQNYIMEIKYESFRPQQGLLIMNGDRFIPLINGYKFSSPTGVTYYE